MAAAWFDVHGILLRVDGLATRWFEEYARFRIDEPRSRPPALRIEPADVPRYAYPDPELDVVPDHVAFDPVEPVIRYGPRAKGGMVIEMTEMFLSWPDRCLVHAASLSRDGRGLLLAAPGATGKTSAMLHLVDRGWEFLADDWSLVDAGGVLHPFPKDIHFYDYNLRENPEIAARALATPRAALAAYSAYAAARLRIAASLPRAPRFLFAHLVKKRTWTFGPEALGARVGAPALAQTAIWLERARVPEIESLPVTLEDLVARIVAYVRHDRSAQLRIYHRLAAAGRAPWLAHLSQLDEHYGRVLRPALSRASGLWLLRLPAAATPREVATAIERIVTDTPRRILTPAPTPPLNARGVT